ncbi:MAG: GNAT family N-acetyltransferase [Saprospiraceae bacterium]|nr:GNAT family N-acetyltransferase [Saprospiraceae bacterium]
MKLKILRTDATHKDFIELVKLLDTDLAKTDGEEHSFYSQFNKVDKIKHVVLVYEEEKALGCGAIRAYADGVVEVKRMYVLPAYRGKGVATKILFELEGWAAELFYTTCILETGKRQPDAIHLYQKNGYQLIPNYGQYAGVENSLCFEKKL